MVPQQFRGFDYPEMVEESGTKALAAWLEHLAEERGETFDAASVGDGPFRILQLKGTGARID